MADDVDADGSTAVVASSRAGDVIDACNIDLPKNDVVEAIEFERFFQLNLRYQEFQRPATMLSAWVSQSDGLSDEDLAPLATALNRSAPLSALRRDWEIHEVQLSTESAGASRAETPSRAHRSSPRPGALNQALVPTVDPGEYRLAFYLPYRQEWRLLGYNRGRMVSSLTLGPQEEQTIEIFTWDRVSRSLDSTTSFESDQTNESSGTRRDTNDITKDITRQSGFEMTSDAKVGFKVEVVNADISAGMNAKTALNDSDKSARQSITEATARAATHVRSSRTLKVLETREYGQETRVTRKLRNHNTCHTLTTAFFEILANYEVSTFLRTDGIRLVVLLKSATLSDLRAFDRRAIRTHERTLTMALLDPTLSPGFASARYLDARGRACKILCNGCDCGAGGIVGRDAEWEALEAALTTFGQVVAALRGYTVIFPASVLIALLELPTGVPGAGAMDIKRYMFIQALAAHAPRLLGELGGLPFNSVNPALADSVMSTIGSITSEDLGLLVADKKISDGMWWTIYGAVFLNTPAPDPISQAAIAWGRTDVLVRGIGGLQTFDDGGLVAACNDVKAKYASWQAYLAEKREADEKAAALERIASEERALRVLDAFPLRETADAEERLDALLEHLNDPRNIDHYRFAVWNERAGATDPKLLALALAGFTEGAPVGVVGDDLAVPVKVAPGTPLERFVHESIADLVAMSARDIDSHLLPTSALYAESIPGNCGACEPNVMRGEELDLARRELDNSLLQLEADRRSAKLAAKDYDEAPPPPALRIELVGAAAAVTPPPPTTPGP